MYTLLVELSKDLPLGGGHDAAPDGGRLRSLVIPLV